jgi:hypothetical protein
MNSILWRFLFWKKRSLVPSGGDTTPIFKVVSTETESGTLFDNGRIKVTPKLIWIGERKSIVVAQIKNFRWGKVREDGLGWCVTKVILILLGGGVFYFWLFKEWLYFWMCVFGLVEGIWSIWKWPYHVRIQTSPLWGDSVEFADRRELEACVRAIGLALKSVTP